MMDHCLFNILVLKLVKTLLSIMLILLLCQVLINFHLCIEDLVHLKGGNQGLIVLIEDSSLCLLVVKVLGSILISENLLKSFLSLIEGAHKIVGKNILKHLFVEALHGLRILLLIEVFCLILIENNLLTAHHCIQDSMLAMFLLTNFWKICVPHLQVVPVLLIKFLRLICRNHPHPNTNQPNITAFPISFSLLPLCIAAIMLVLLLYMMRLSQIHIRHTPALYKILFQLMGWIWVIIRVSSLNLIAHFLMLGPIIVSKGRKKKYFFWNSLSCW